jgi:hypothetical protein
MNIELRISFSDADEFGDLQEWLKGIDEVKATPASRPVESNSQGSALDFLTVAFETGGPVVVALQALKMWLEARVTTIQVKVGESVFTVRSSDAAAMLPKIQEAIRVLAEGEEKQ